MVFSGTLDALMLEPRSLTSKYLRGELAIPVPTTRRRGTGQKIQLLGASEHNLKDIDVAIPLNVLTVVTGVSGSGKSTLVHDVLYAAIKRAKGGWDKRVGAFEKLEGVEFITDAVLVDQAPIGRTPRLNSVHPYLKAFDPIREKLFAAVPRIVRGRAGLTASTTFPSTCPAAGARPARARVRSASKCSFWPTCSCRAISATGKRFKPQVLQEVRYRGDGPFIRSLI